MKIKKLFITLIMCLSLLSVLSCAELMIVDTDGMPVRTNDVVMSNPATGIDTHFYIQKIKEVSSDSVVPEYLNVFETYTIYQKDTKGLFMVLRVKDIKTKKTYQLRKMISYREGWSTPKVLVDSVIYKGNDIDRSWQISLPITIQGSYLASIRIEDTKEMPIAFYEFKYHVR